MLTLFTPTHDVTYLARLAASVAAQTSCDFEWLIVPNGGVDVAAVHSIVGSMPNARVLPYYGKTNNIGELKRFCCTHALGEFVAEVDHDDEITQNCVARLYDKFSEGFDFVYSNCAEVKDGKPFTYSENYGWRYRPFMYGDTLLQECIAFDPSPASFSRIWFGPNHIRAWRRDFYEKIGGHDVTRAVLDDQDLVCRSYIHGRVGHIDECLYVYHVHPKNTCKGELNAFIQQETLRLHDKYIYKLAEKWCDLNGLRKIDLCGGHGKPEGYESVDVQNADVIADLNYRWPFESGSVGLIRAHDALEHLRDPLHTMKEAYRCLANNGWLLTLTPSTDGRGAWQDPTHVSFWNRNSFFYYTRAEQAKYIGTPVRFQEVRIKDFHPSKWHEVNNCPYVKADLLKFSGRVPGGIGI
jgi:hypothetical protein